MASAKVVGRLIGLTLLVQAGLTPVIYARLLPPVTGRTFLTTAATHAPSIRFALLLSFLLSVVTLGVALAVLPIVRSRSERLAIAYVGIAVLGMATMAAEGIAFRNVLALSLEFASPSAPHEVLRSVAAAAYSTALMTHFTNLLVSHGAALVLYLALFRLAVVPRALAACGIAAHVIGAVDVAQPLLGGEFSFVWVIPAGVCLLALIGWLLTRGFGASTAVV
jgi:hypothetical protein